MPIALDLQPIRVRNQIVEFPVHHMRGGTSTGLVLWDAHLPVDHSLKEELIRHLMGVPLSGDRKGNKQITGLGRGPATSNKVFIVALDDDPAIPTVRSTLAQLASDHGNIDWSVNCGNMSASLPLWAFDVGYVAPQSDAEFEIRIFNTNTNVFSTARMTLEDGRFVAAEIPGVDGAYPAVDLYMLNPVGAKTGKLLPTGQALDHVLGYTVSCVDVAVPMVIADASQFGKTGLEPVADLEADMEFMTKFREVWIAAGLKMGLRKRDGQLMTETELRASETVPKACIVGHPKGAGNISVRYFTPQQGHASMAVSGACCLAAACLVPGSVAHQVASKLPSVGNDPIEVVVGVENPAGNLEARVDAVMSDGLLHISRAAYRRSAQVLARGYVPLYRASRALKAALTAGPG